MQFAITITAENPIQFTALVEMLMSNGFIANPKITHAHAIIDNGNSHPVEMLSSAEVKEKRAKKAAATPAPVTTPTEDKVDYTAPEYLEVANATTALSGECGRDAVVGLLNSFGLDVEKGQTARNLPRQQWEVYAAKANKLVDAAKAKKATPKTDTASLV